MNIYLIGFMGSGKSSAGKGIAALLRWKFADLDKLVEEKEGMTVPGLFAQRERNISARPKPKPCVRFQHA